MDHVVLSSTEQWLCEEANSSEVCTLPTPASHAFGILTSLDSNQSPLYATIILVHSRKSDFSVSVQMTRDGDWRTNTVTSTLPLPSCLGFPTSPPWVLCRYWTLLGRSCPLSLECQDNPMRHTSPSYAGKVLFRVQRLGLIWLYTKWLDQVTLIVGLVLGCELQRQILVLLQDDISAK
jgi:hypothetical protein